MLLTEYEGFCNEICPYLSDGCLDICAQPIHAAWQLLKGLPVFSRIPRLQS